MAHRGTAVGPLRAILFTLACAAVPAGAAAQHLVAQPFATGLSFPTAFVGDPTAANRHFVVEQNGRIRVLVDGVVQATPFLDLTAAISSGPERGLLGMALDPDYATNRRFYRLLHQRQRPDRPARPRSEIWSSPASNDRSAIHSLPTLHPASISSGSASAARPYIEHSQFGNHNGG